MKKVYKHAYSEISSFEDFRVEKELLLLRNQLIEAKLNLTYIEIRKAFSVSNILISVAKETVVPKISDFLKDLLSKVEKSADS